MATPPTFFVDHKKGEVNEIKMLLRNPTTDKDPVKKKEILKKVVALMTMGIDMSELFADIIICSRTKVRS
jgi:vesicle coat complex subunit